MSRSFQVPENASTDSTICFRVFVDDVEIKGINGGKAYESYGISSEGAVVVVRPDGYVAMVAPLEGAAELEQYFAGFLLPGA